MFATPRGLFRTLAFAEVVTWTLLITGLIIRATTDLTIAATIAGSIHGFVFLSYAATAVLVSKNNRWGFGPAVLAIGSAIIPYATIPTELWLDRRGRLEGSWRLDATDDPRDHAWHDRFMRWLLRRPAFLVGFIVLAVIAIFVILVIIGPPGGRH